MPFRDPTPYLEPGHNVTSPAPLPLKTTSDAPTGTIKTVSKENYVEHQISLQLNNQGMAVITTPAVIGYLECVRIQQNLPSRIIIRNTVNSDQVLYNTYQSNALFEDAYIRSRTQDCNGRFFNEATRYFLNYPLDIEVHGPAFQHIVLHIVVVKA